MTSLRPRAVIRCAICAVREYRYPAIVIAVFAFALALTFKPAAVALVDVLMEILP
jgi:hypothetical protein